MSGKLLISAFVFVMGFLIAASPSVSLINFYFVKGEVVTAKYLSSVKVTNAKDTVMIPSYTFSRKITPLVQNCTLPMQNYIHAVGSQPKYAELQLKIKDKCDDYVVLNDPPYEKIPLTVIGFIMMLVGGILFYKALESARK